MNMPVLFRVVVTPRWAQQPTANPAWRCPAPTAPVEVAPTEAVPAEAPAPASDVSSGWRVVARRVGLLVGCVAAAVLAWAAASGVPRVAEPELAVLLRGMAAIKGLLGVLAAGLVYWRFGLPISARAAWAYALAVGLMFAATALIWQLAAMGLAAAMFHVGCVGALLVAWREGRPTFGAGWRSRSGRQTA